MSSSGVSFPSTDDTGPSYPSRSKGSTAKAKQLLEAAGQGNLEEVVSLLNAGGDGINSMRVRGCTALHEAAKGGHLPVVEDLLRLAAEVNAVNRSGCTPLHFAALCKDKHRALDVATHLLDARAAVNATGERMDTPLHFAAYCPESSGCEALASCLVERRASVNMRNKRYETALMNAALHDNADVVRLLLQKGAEPSHQNSLSKSARDLAQEQGCSAALRVFEEQADPIAQLRDLSQQMSTTLSQMQAPDWMRNQLHSQSAMARAYEAVAQSVIAELDQDSRTQLADGALQALRAPGSSSDPARRLQSLATLRLIARESSGPALLQGLGLGDVLPQVEQQVAQDRAGQLALQELQAAMSGGRPQELLNADFLLSGAPVDLSLLASGPGGLLQGPRPHQRPTASSSRAVSSAATSPSRILSCQDEESESGVAR